MHKASCRKHEYSGSMSGNSTSGGSQTVRSILWKKGDRAASTALCSGMRSPASTNTTSQYPGLRPQFYPLETQHCCVQRDASWLRQTTHSLLHTPGALRTVRQPKF